MAMFDPEIKTRHKHTFIVIRETSSLLAVHGITFETNGGVRSSSAKMYGSLDNKSLIYSNGMHDGASCQKGKTTQRNGGVMSTW